MCSLMLLHSQLARHIQMGIDALQREQNKKWVNLVTIEQVRNITIQQ